jgi:hypothetical protein
MNHTTTGVRLLLDRPERSVALGVRFHKHIFWMDGTVLCDMREIGDRVDKIIVEGRKDGGQTTSKHPQFD